MRFITLLRRLDNHKKDRIILISSISLTCIIAVGGFLFTHSSFYTRTHTNDQVPETTTIRTLIGDIKAAVTPPVKDVQENINTISSGYKKGSFKDLFVPKSE